MIAPRPITARKPTVLVVDDVSTNIDVLVEHLGDEHLELVVALSGEEGLFLARSCLPDLILLDVMMPGMDGYTLCQILKQDPQLADIPVVFLTARDEECEVERGFALGAVDYIHKPFSLPILKARVRSHLALKLKGDLLTNLACTDSLTGIANRRHFDINLTSEWLRAQRSRTPLSVIMIDVDFFKGYNDHYGHCAGDTCLKAVAKALFHEFNRPGDLLARYGGEEFVALLPETGLADASALAERLRLAVLRLQLPHCRSTVADCVSISLGVATTNARQAGTADILLVRADEQLYRAKQGGRNQVSAALMAVDSVTTSHSAEA